MTRSDMYTKRESTAVTQRVSKMASSRSRSRSMRCAGSGRRHAATAAAAAAAATQAAAGRTCFSMSAVRASSRAMSPSSRDVSAITSAQLTPPAHASTRPDKGAVGSRRQRVGQEQQAQRASSKRSVCIPIPCPCPPHLCTRMCTCTAANRNTQTRAPHRHQQQPWWRSSCARRQRAHLPGAGRRRGARSSGPALLPSAPRRWPPASAPAPQSERRRCQTPAESEAAQCLVRCCVALCCEKERARANSSTLT